MREKKSISLITSSQRVPLDVKYFLSFLAELNHSKILVVDHPPSRLTHLPLPLANVFFINFFTLIWTILKKFICFFTPAFPFAQHTLALHFKEWHRTAFLILVFTTAQQYYRLAARFVLWRKTKGLKCAIAYFYAAHTTTLAKHTLTQEVFLDQETFIGYNQQNTEKSTKGTSPWK